MAREVDLGKVHGDTPYIGEDGNWWIGDKNTGVMAESSEKKAIIHQEIKITSNNYSNRKFSFTIANLMTRTDIFTDFDVSNDLLEVSISINPSRRPNSAGSPESTENIEAVGSMIYSNNSILGIKLFDGSYYNSLNEHWIGKINEIASNVSDIILNIGVSTFPTKHFGTYYITIILKPIKNYIKDIIPI